MPAKILVVYYTQTGQLYDIVQSFISPIRDTGDVTVVYEEIKPKPAFPYPWTSDTFFQAMPESVMGIPCELVPFSFKGDEDYDLIIVAWQPWYLSPSIPVHAFFQHDSVMKLLNGKPVVTLIGCRNMWAMAQERIKEYIRAANAKLVGNVLFYDKAPNLVSVITIIRWLFKGVKDRYLGIFPAPGISENDVKGAARYGEIIYKAVTNGDYSNLQQHLIEAGAVDVKPGLVMIEKRGIIFFRLWAAFILKKGNYGSSARLTRVRLFKYYLLFMIYIISPFVSGLYYLIKPFRKKAVYNQVLKIQSCQ